MSLAESGRVGDHHLLQGALRVSREWVAGLPGHDLQREAILHLGTLANDLIRDGNAASLLAMTQLRALLCGNCRHLNAAYWDCSRQSLEQCLLLKRTS